MYIISCKLSIIYVISYSKCSIICMMLLPNRKITNYSLIISPFSSNFHNSSTYESDEFLTFFPPHFQ